MSEDEETAYEGCLSFPGHNGAVTRPAAVKVRARDRHGEWFELEAEGLLARCIQHENDSSGRHHHHGVQRGSSMRTPRGRAAPPRQEEGERLMRILFMGTPDIAADCLKALYEAGHDICAVYTRRDKPVGRKRVLTAPPVKEVALAHGTPVFQPRTLRDGGEDENIRALALSSSSWWPTAASCRDRCWKRRNTAASTSTSPCCRNTGAAPPCSGRC